MHQKLDIINLQPHSCATGLILFGYHRHVRNIAAFKPDITLQPAGKYWVSHTVGFTKIAQSKIEFIRTVVYIYKISTFQLLVYNIPLFLIYR